MDAPDCKNLDAVLKKLGFIGKVAGGFLACAAFLRPFSNLILKGALALGAHPHPFVKIASKVLWVFGTLAALPCLGTPAVMQDVYAGKVTPPTAKGGSEKKSEGEPKDPCPEDVAAEEKPKRQPRKAPSRVGEAQVEMKTRAIEPKDIKEYQAPAPEAEKALAETEENKADSEANAEPKSPNDITI